MAYPSNQPTNDHVRSYFDRWRHLEAQKAEIGEDLKELFAEAKGNGYDTKAMRAAFRRKVEMEDIEAVAAAEEFDAAVELYLNALTGTVVATRAHRAPEAVTAPKPLPDDAIMHQPATAKSVANEPSVQEGSAGVHGQGEPTPATGEADPSPAPIRPYCLHPEKCGGQGRIHCYSCQRAHDQAGAA